MWKTTSALWAASTGTMSSAVDALKYINVNKKGSRASDTSFGFGGIIFFGVLENRGGFSDGIM